MKYIAVEIPDTDEALEAFVSTLPFVEGWRGEEPRLVSSARGKAVYALTLKPLDQDEQTRRLADLYAAALDA